MQIIYSHDIFSSQAYGGISRYFIELIRNLEGSADLRIYGGFYIGQYFKDYPETQKFLHGIQAINFPYTKHLRLRINELYQAYKISQESNYLVHQTYWFTQPNPKIKKMVVTVHDMIHEIFPENFSPKDPTSFFKKKYCQKADQIIAVSNSTKNDLVRLFKIPPEKITVVHHGTPQLSAPTPSINPGITTSPYLLYVGGRESYKNFPGFLKAFAKTRLAQKDFRIVCFGGPPFLEMELMLINQCNLSSKIQHISGNDALLAQYYRSARALIYPSKYEGFGFPLVEAMNLGCPVFCSNVSSLPEVVGSAAVYFDPNDLNTLTEALDEFLYSETLLDDLRKKGFERSFQFTWKQAANQTLSVYKKLE